MTTILYRLGFLAKAIRNSLLSVSAALLLSACAKPVAKFSSDLSNNSAAATIKFVNQSIKAESYVWDFGDGVSSTETNPSHRYPSSGNYLVTLQATAKDRIAIDSQFLQILAPATCMVEISTSFGNILLSLSDNTPMHRDNFYALVEDEFYHDLIFHRVIDGFVVQGGDPTGIGTGGPGHEIPAEFDQSLAHVRGALAAARTPDEENPERNSNGSQFYIVSGRPVTDLELDKMQVRKGITYSSAIRQAYLDYGGLPILDANYTVFGQVEEGMDVIDALSRVETDEYDRPKEELLMKIRVID